MQHINDAIAKVKEDFTDPIIFVGGDFNNFDTAIAFDDFPDMKILQTEPTRGTARLDIVCTNIHDNVTSTSIRKPLASEDGRTSNHAILNIACSMENSDRFTKSIYWSRKITMKGKNKLKNWIRTKDWNEIISIPDADDAVCAFVEEIDKAMDECLPKTKKTIKSSDDPWITPFIKKRIANTKRIFNREDRSDNWREAKRETNLLIRNSKKDYYTNLAKKTEDPSLYFKMVGRLKSCEATRPFDIMNLFKGVTEQDAAVADYFMSILSRFDPLEERSDGDDGVLVVEEEEVVQRLRTCKKPKGLLTGDLPLNVLTDMASAIAIPLTMIFMILRKRGGPLPGRRI